MSTPEGKVKSDIKRVLDSHGFWKAGGPQPDVVNGWYYMPIQNGLGTSGIPDFVGTYRGRLFCIEAKAPGGKPTENQKQRHVEISAAGGVVLLVDSAEPVRKFLCMADIIDIANDRAMLDSENAEREARGKSTKLEAEPTGACLYCGDTVLPTHRWCSSAHRDLWEAEARLKKLGQKVEA